MQANNQRSTHSLNEHMFFKSHGELSADERSGATDSMRNMNPLVDYSDIMKNKDQLN